MEQRQRFTREDGADIAVGFKFNGWGGKYLMDGDQEIGAELAQSAGLPVRTADWILEGGAVDTDAFEQYFAD